MGKHMTRLPLFSMLVFASVTAACSTDELAGDPVTDDTSGDTADVAAEPGTSSELQSELALTRPTFKMPFLCDQTWLGNNWNGHSPAHSIDWNHYDASGSPDDYGRRVLASAGGTVLESYYSTGSGYGNVIVIGHGGRVRPIVPSPRMYDFRVAARAWLAH